VPPWVKDQRSITSRRPARRTGGHAGLKAAPAIPVLSAMTPAMSSARSALADLVRDVRLMGHRRAGDGLERVVTRYPGATSRDEEIARRASLCWFPAPRWCASVRLTIRRTAVERESRCVPLPRVASGRLGFLQIGCDSNQPCR